MNSEVCFALYMQSDKNKRTFFCLKIDQNLLSSNILKAPSTAESMKALQVFIPDSISDSLGKIYSAQKFDDWFEFQSESE